MLREWINLAVSVAVVLGTSSSEAVAGETLSLFTGEEGSSFRIVALPGVFDGLNDVSADGSTAVGSSGGFGTFTGYTVDTATGAFQELNRIPGGVPERSISSSHDTEGRAISGTGDIAFGFAEAPGLANLFATAYPRIGDASLLTVLGNPPGVQDDGDLPGGNTFGEPHRASFDGSAVVGRSTSTNGTEAFRWTAATGMVGLGDLPGGSFHSRAMGVSSDGTVVVGDSTAAAGVKAFRWTQATGMVDLGSAPGGLNVSSAFGVSGDGSVAVGEVGILNPGVSGANRVPGKWTQADGWVDLGPLPANEAREDGQRFGIATDASFDGSVIVGNVANVIDTGNGQTAFAWSEAHGMRTLKQLLIDAGIADLADWSNLQATAISDDGRVVVGSGTSPINSFEAWIVTLPSSFIGGSVAGDFNGSGQVEQGDLDLVLQNWGVDTDVAGVPAGWVSDLPNGQIEQTELDKILQNWGNTSAPNVTGSAVPEPASGLIAAVAVALVPRRANRQCQRG